MRRNQWKKSVLNGTLKKYFMIFSIRYVYMGTLKNRHQSLAIESSVEFIEKNYRTDETI